LDSNLHFKGTIIKNRQYQEICKQKFNAHLATKLDANDVKWLPGDEPPDYYLITRGIKYAVEATTIVLEVAVGQKELELQTITHSLYDLVKEVEKQGCHEGILSGTYFVILSQLSPGFGKIKESIKEEILSYLRHTQENDFTSMETIFENNDLKCFILKKNNISSRVEYGGGPVVAKWEPEREACSLLQAMMEKKYEKLLKVRHPKILLLLNTNFSFNTSYLKNCTPELTILKKFHTVFIVGFKEEEDYVLFSKNADWY
jgi:hypothetical protein